MITNLGTVLEAAEIRASQWRAIADGKQVMEDDVVDELFVDSPDEAACIADEQEKAISHVRGCLPAGGTRVDLDQLAVNAMCIWEAMLEARRKSNSEFVDVTYDWLADGEGAFAARDGAWSLAGLAEAAWQSICTQDGDPPRGFDAFDWDFIPCWLPEVATLARALGLTPATVSEEVAVQAAQNVIQEG